MWKTRETILESVTIGQPVVPPDVDRVTVFITNTGTSTIHLSTLPPPYVTTAGMPIAPQNTLILRWNAHGDLARIELRCVDPQPAQEVHVVETLFWPDNGGPSG